MIQRGAVSILALALAVGGAFAQEAKPGPKSTAPAKVKTTKIPPAGKQAPKPADAAPAPKRVEYATGTVVTSDGAILTNRSSVDGCNVITVSGFGYAARVAEDPARDLALVRLYGVKTSPLAISATAVPAAGVVVTGIADPQAQNGAANVSTLSLQANGTGSDAATLSPVPAAGFLGAPALDSTGKFTGVVVAKSGTTAAISGAEGVRAFLLANGILPSGGTSDPKSSVVRLICSRA